VRRGVRTQGVSSTAVDERDVSEDLGSGGPREAGG
ncbi:MAG: hypothetical protein ACI8PZ_006289, partial [Myxococcota bacterium]